VPDTEGEPLYRAALQAPTYRLIVQQIDNAINAQKPEESD
jgi:hypothetical protein